MLAVPSGFMPLKQIKTDKCLVTGRDLLRDKRVFVVEPKAYCEPDRIWKIQQAKK